MAARTERRGERATEQEFTLVLEGQEILEPRNLDLWFEAGCEDATFGEVDGVGFADFARRARTAPEAILSAIDQIEAAVPTVRVIRVEPDDLVNASDIAGRLGRTRESVRLLIAGERGPGGFPPPLSHLKARGRLWRWAEVVRWARKGLDDQLPDADAAIFVAGLNDALDLRRLSPELEAGNWLTSVAELLDPRLRGPTGSSPPARVSQHAGALAKRTRQGAWRSGDALAPGR